MRTTYITKPNEVEREWFVIDANNRVLGRVATQVASILRGKHKAIFMPNVDAGDYVVIINSEKIKLTGKKKIQKVYRRHTGYPGGMKTITLKDCLEKRSEFVLQHAVKGMLPKNNLGRAMIKKLYIYSGDTHKHHAQKPKKLKLKY
jgi:large subunit ribosomal protein L13